MPHLCFLSTMPPLLLFMVFPLLIILIFHFTVIRQITTSSRKKNLPPAPPSLPLIGHLHYLGRLPHRSLRKLSSSHGPIMFLHLGRVPTIVLSSASAVQEAISLHDLALSNRPHIASADILAYGSTGVIFLEYGQRWRRARQIFTVQLLSVKQVESFRHLRQQETTYLVERIRRDGCSGEKAINLSKLLFDVTNSIVCRAGFGQKFVLEHGRSIQKVLSNAFELLLVTRIGEFIPWLSWIDWLRGIDKRAKATADILDQFLEGVIQKHLEKRTICDDAEKMEANFIDHVLDVMENDRETGTSQRMEKIKVLLSDLIFGGIDTTYITMEFAMAELISHPEVMERVQQEVRKTIRTCDDINEDSISKMSFLKAVISETLRLHPPAPILVPRETTEDIQLLGYQIPAKTRVIINAWAIGRDPQRWGTNAEEFWPERFIGSSIEYNGQDFQFVPFGVGRRGCPGINSATRVIELVLANLLYNFDWMLHDEKGGESLDMTESAGLTVDLKKNLIVLAKPFVQLC